MFMRIIMHLREAAGHEPAPHQLTCAVLLQAPMRLQPEDLAKLVQFLQQTPRVRGLSLAHNWIGADGVQVSQCYLSHDMMQACRHYCWHMQGSVLHRSILQVEITPLVAKHKLRVLQEDLKSRQQAICG